MEVQGSVDPDLVFVNKRLVEVVDYWHKIRNDREMPAHKDIDALQVPCYLWSHLALIEVQRQTELRFRWRLIGTHITTAVSRDATGKYFDELYDGENFDTVTDPFKWVVKNAEPL